MRATFMVPLILLLAVGVAPAQTDQSLPRGARVRVTPASASPTIVGQLIAVSDSALVVRRQRGGGDITIPRSDVMRLEISRGTRRGANAGSGALYGGVIGGLAGYAVGEDRCGSDAWFCFKRPAASVLGSITGVVTGTFIGLIVGSFERWGDAEVPMSLSVVPTRDGSLAIVSRVPF